MKKCSKTTTTVKKKKISSDTMKGEDQGRGNSTSSTILHQLSQTKPSTDGAFTVETKKSSAGTSVSLMLRSRSR